MLRIPATADPYVEGFTLTATFSFTSWHDSATGYTINGTATAVLESNIALNDTKTHPRIQTQTMTGTLSLSGGPISSLTANYSIHSVDDPDDLEGSGVFFSGTITADGHSFDVSSLIP